MVIALILIIAVLTIILIVGLRIYGFAAKAKGEKKVDYLIILGASIVGMKPGKHLTVRLDTAIDMLRKNPDIIVITSGGKGDDEKYPEADVMKKYILDNVTGDASGDVTVIAEANSCSTYENLLLSKELIKDEGVRVGIVTNGFHLLRSMKIANKVGIKNAVPIYAPSLKEYLLHDVMREIAILIIGTFYYPKRAKRLKRGSAK